MNETRQPEQSMRQLASLIQRHAPADGTYSTSVPALTLRHATKTSEPMESVHQPSICIVAQGAKTVTLADETYRYDPSTFLVVSVELPMIGRIVVASPEVPYLALKLSFDTDVVLDIVKEMGETRQTERGGPSRGVAVTQVSPALLQAVARLLELLDAPEDIPILSPLLIREILYRVLQSEQGALVRQFAMIGSHAQRIAKAIQRINREYDCSLAVEELAESVHMSTSAFHKHFKRVTSLSPLQYQKTVRLQEARRFMLTEGMPAADAAFRVGYESPSQFSREYARMYGRPPMLDIRGLREAIAEVPR
ncbi:AraC family transcriptional regulator [uncultured Paenibacillus sp.]|uniref:AraC family transcriptional regulator n=1 Tax=uncultured Paenibacillus sp. TaxID=227322 RepID=UPI0015AD39F7|nr:AraC family transcriptional regulator [uncultured Paenibacillus sp.]